MTTTDQQAVTVAQELKPCPFCGSDTAPYVYPTPVAHWFGVACDDEKGGCSACVIGDGREIAIMTWNMRTPEPVPATNQAGEVERRIDALVRRCAAWQNAVVSPGFDNRLAEAANEARAILALATQPATSQEGNQSEIPISSLAATPTPPTLSEDLREVLEFYADRDGDGYQVDVTNYGLSTEESEIVRDRGERARAALAQVKA